MSHKRSLALVLTLTLTLALGAVGCTQKEQENTQQEITNTYEGYTGLGYDLIYNKPKDEDMQKAIEKYNNRYERDYDYSLIDKLDNSSQLTLKEYNKTLEAIFGKFLYTYTLQSQTEETVIDKSFIENITNKLVTLQEVGKASGYNEKVSGLDSYYEATISAMKELINNLDNDNYSEYIDYKGRARLTLQTLISTCTNEVVLRNQILEEYDYNPKKYDSIQFQLEHEVLTIREYMNAISLSDDALTDEDYVSMIKRLEKIQKSVNESSQNKEALDKVNKQFTLVYNEIDKSREIVRDNYEKAKEQKGANGDNIGAIRGVDLDLATKINNLAVMLSGSGLY